MAHKEDEAYFKSALAHLHEYCMTIPKLSIMEEIDETKRLKLQVTITPLTIVEARVFLMDASKRLKPQLGISIRHLKVMF